MNKIEEFEKMKDILDHFDGYRKEIIEIAINDTSKNKEYSLMLAHRLETLANDIRVTVKHN